MTMRSIFTAGSALPEPPRVVGIWSRAGLFCNVRPIGNSSQFGGIWGGVICLGGSNDVPDELANGGVQAGSDPIALRQRRQSPWVAFRCSLPRLPIDSPSMGFLWARLEARLN